MSIPLNFNPLGFTLAPVEPSELPAGYTRLAFLEGTGTQYVNTQLPFSSESKLSVTFAMLARSADNVNGGIFAGSYRTTSRALTLTQKIAHNLNNARFGSLATNSYYFYLPDFSADIYTATNDKNAVTLNGEAQHNWAGQSAWTSASGDALYLFRANADSSGNFAPKSLRIYAAELITDSVTTGDLAPAVDPAGSPGMYDKTRQMFFGNAGSGSFIAGIETLSQLTALASNLPTVTGAPEIKLSLPGEWNGDASANAQLSIISGKGWSTTITYRDVETSTSSSFVLGNRGDGGSALVLWCKAVESEYGNYEDADGVRYHIETCHDIWHPQELSPDDLGYTAVLTLEDYLTERGLTAVEYDEDELTANLADN